MEMVWPPGPLGRILRRGLAAEGSDGRRDCFPSEAAAVGTAACIRPAGAGRGRAGRRGG